MQLCCTLQKGMIKEKSRKGEKAIYCFLVGGLFLSTIGKEKI